MADHPFATTKLRQIWVFIGLWGVAITSIILSTTSSQSIESTLGLLFIGEFYSNARLSLTEFVEIAAIPEWIVLASYGLLSVLLICVSLAILVIGMDTMRRYVQMYILMFTSLFLSTAVLLVFLSLLDFTSLSGITNILLSITPPALTLSSICLVISLITSIVP